MTINQRQKGAAAERQLAAMLRDMGFTDARRTAQFNGNGNIGDVICEKTLPNISIECKAVQGLAPGTKQFDDYFQRAERDAGKKRAVMFWKPRNNGVFYLTFRDDKFGMMTLHESKDVAVALRMLDGEVNGGAT